MHPIGRIVLASHALPVAAAVFPGSAWPLLTVWAAAQAAFASALLRPASARLAPNVRRGKESGARIALTFDDGPFEGETERVLDILGSAGARAAFFLVGRRARAHPALVRRIADAGHTLGNHTQTHPPHWSVVSRRRVFTEVGDAQAAIADAAGDAPVLFRPPVGHKNVHMAEALEANGLTQVTWSLRSYDTILRDPHRVLKRVLPRARGADIVLLHEGLTHRGGPLAPATLPALLEGLAAAGLTPVSLQALLSTPPVPTRPAPPSAPPASGSDGPGRSSRGS